MSDEFTGSWFQTALSRHFLVELHSVGRESARWCLETGASADAAAAAAVARNPGFRAVRVTCADGVVRELPEAGGGGTA